MYLYSLTGHSLTCNSALMRYQRDWPTKESGSWLGHFNRRFRDAATGAIVRQQPAFIIGRVADMTKAQAQRARGEYVEQAAGLRRRTTREGVFAGDDSVTRAATVILAMDAARPARFTTI